MPHQLALKLIGELRRVGTLSISLDLDDHDLLGQTNLDTIFEPLRYVDLFLPSHQDILAIFPGVEPIEGLRKLRTLAPDVALIAIKCGQEGVIGHVTGTRESIHIPALAVEAVDVTGAGDAFCGGALAGFAEKSDPIEALLYGAVSASFCIEGFGLSGLAGATEERARERLDLLRRGLSRADRGCFPRG
jgi:sugar/nucleoside kinase (ribokinase family)